MDASIQTYSTTRLLLPKQESQSNVFERRKGLSSQTVKGGLYFKDWVKATHPDYPLVTVITVLKNSRNVLEETIQSVLNQDYPNIEYLIVDGQSTDGSIDLIRGYDDFLDLWISEPDTGFYNGLNKAILLAFGEYINVLNADDHYVDKRTVSRFVRAFKETNPDLVYCDTLVLNKDKGSGWIRYSQLTRFHLANGGFAQQNFFYRKSLFDRIGLFDESFKIAGDYEFLIRAVVHHKVAKSYINGPNIVYSYGGISAKPHNERMKALRPYYPRWELWLFTRKWFRAFFNNVDFMYRIGRIEWFVRKIFRIWT